MLEELDVYEVDEMVGSAIVETAARLWIAARRRIDEDDPVAALVETCVDTEGGTNGLADAEALGVGVSEVLDRALAMWAARAAT